MAQPEEEVQETVSMWSVQMEEVATRGSSGAGTERGEVVRL